MPSRRLAVAVLPLVLAAPMAESATSFAFTATDFTPAGNPIDPVEVAFSFAFDFPTATDVVAGTDVTLDFANFALDESLQYNYDISTDVLQVGGGVPESIASFGNDVSITIFEVTTAPRIGTFLFSQSDEPEVSYEAETVNEGIGAVPLPAAGLLMLAGIAALGLAGRRRGDGAA